MKINMVKLSDVADVVNGFGFNESFQGQVGLPIPFIKVSDFIFAEESWISKSVNTVDNDILAELKAQTYPEGTIIFPKVGGALLTNKRARLKVRATFDNNIMGIIPQNINPEYLYYFICLFDMVKLANVQSIPSIRASDVSNIQINPRLSVRQYEGVFKFF